MISFDEYMATVWVWPKGVPKECTRLDAQELDCLERGDAQPCESCIAFGKCAEDYENDRETAQKGGR